MGRHKRRMKIDQNTIKITLGGTVSLLAILVLIYILTK